MSAMKAEARRYEGTIYPCAVGSDTEAGVCRDSLAAIRFERGDAPLAISRATKGYEARQKHINEFLKSKHDFILMLDADMVFPVETAERLRGHGLPYVSGLYMRRNLQPLAPVWYRPFSGRFPMLPWVGPIQRGVLHPIGASGWGCMLIHRDVIMAVRGRLKGEWEVLEDDLDIYPYDLRAIMGAMRGIQNIVETRPSLDLLLPALTDHYKTLRREIKPLRGDKADVVGSDIRFPFFALQAGYQLMGDPDLRPGHVIHYPLGAGDYDNVPEAALIEAEKQMRGYWKKERAGLDAKRKAVMNG